MKIKKNIIYFSLSIILIGCILFTLGFTKFNENKEHLNLDKDYTYSNLKDLDLDIFNQINIDVTSLNIDFIESENYGIELNHDQDKTFKYQVSDNNLIINETTYLNNKNSFFNLLSFIAKGINTKKANNYLHIYLPKSNLLKNVNITNNIGLTSLENLKIENSVLISNIGEIIINSYIKNLIAENNIGGIEIINQDLNDNQTYVLKNNIGEITVNSYIKSLTVENNIGEINIINKSLSSEQNYSIENNIGSIYIETNSSTNFKKLKNNIGEIKINYFEKISK